MSKQTTTKVPQIRFKGFEEEWVEEPLLSRINGIIDFRGRTPKKLGLDWSPSGYLALSALNVKDGYIDRYADAHYGDEELYTKWMKGNELHFNQVLFTTEAPMGNVAQIPDTQKYILSQRTIAFVTDAARLSEDYLAVLLKSPNVFGALLARSSGGTAKGVSQKSLSSVHVRVSDELTEQTQVGKYFRELDRLIELHQRKHDKLVTLKKAMLKKMFPQPGVTTPEIRFKGFSGEWDEKKLGDSTTNVTNNTLSRANLNFRSGLARNVHYGDILVQYGEVLDVQKNGIPFISDAAVATKLKSSNLANGDIVVADAAEDEMVGKCTEIQNIGDQIVLAGLHTIALRPLFNFAPFYLGYYLNSDAFHDQLLPIMQGTKVLSISKTAIKHTAICFPIDEAEQQKIGSYFRTLDELISKHTIQLNKLQQIKSACLEKMFV